MGEIALLSSSIDYRPVTGAIHTEWDAFIQRHGQQESGAAGDTLESVYHKKDARSS